MQNDYQVNAKNIVRDYYNSKSEITDGYILAADDVYVVWFSKTLQNWKVLISTTVHDGMYYEVTHDGDKCVTYLDAYKKFDNVSIPD
jgi:hypothetical protein